MSVSVQKGGERGRGRGNQGLEAIIQEGQAKGRGEEEGQSRNRNKTISKYCTVDKLLFEF